MVQGNLKARHAVHGGPQYVSQDEIPLLPTRLLQMMDALNSLTNNGKRR